MSSSIPLSDITVPGPSDVEVDLEGRWVLPGLWDHHVHFGQWAMASRRLDLSSASSAAHVASLVRERLASSPPEAGTVLLGAGFRDGLWADAPSIDLLEFGDVPVALVSGDVHSLWTNRAMLRMLGRPESDWWLREQPAFDLNRELSAVPAEVLDRWAIEAAAAAAARGVTGIVDFEMEDAPGSWARRFGAGFSGLRVKAAVYPHTPELPAVASALFEIGPYKLFTDGSLNTRTAWCDHAYPGTDGHGLPTYGPGELLAAARAGVARGLSPAIHAIGDRAVTEALDVFEALGGSAAVVGGSIEHVQLIEDADLPRFAALGVRASVQPEHAMDDRDVAERYWAGRTGRSFAYRSLLAAGAELALGSDAPVAPLDPWITMAAAVTRSRDGREPWHPEQALTFAAALAASSHDQLGDLVIVESDPFEATNLRDMPVHATMVAGIWTHGPWADR
ncbi:MAG: amidohydrolase family protein [Pseudolysinimonas sp.]|uniref:amidohydrolase family protein n=1 Tax=Pseudolysinimonas sp. TaxID=2680009 RepID=UPI0032639E19